MSLIQEALKRKKEEEDGLLPRADDMIPTGPPATPSLKSAGSPAVPPPPPSTAGATEAPPSAEEALPALDLEGPVPDLARSCDEPPVRPWRALVLILIVVLLLGGGAIWMIAFAVKSLNRPEPAASEEPAQAAPATVAGPDERSETPGVEAAIEAPPVPLATQRPAPRSPATPSVARTPTMLAKPSAVWPALTLSGVIGRGQAGSAVINGEVVGVGDVIEGVKVIAIRPQGVELECQAERQFMKVGSVLQ